MRRRSVELNVGELPLLQAAETPDLRALVSGSQQLTWAELAERSGRLSNVVRDLGLVSGDRVATVLPNGVNSVVSLFALALAGVVVVPVSPRLTARELRAILQDCGAKLAISETEDRGMLATWVGGPDGADIDLDALIGQATPTPAWVESGQSIRTIRYTSGTTGRPKGIVSTHAQTLTSIDAFYRTVPISPGSFLQVLPLSSGAAIWHQIGAAFVGATAVVAEEADPETIERALQEHDVSHTCLVPTMARRLVNHRAGCAPTSPSAHRLTVGCTGSALSPDLLLDLRRCLGAEIYSAYGGGETGGLVSYLLPAEVQDAAESGDLSGVLASVGRPAPHASIEIDSADVGQPGEILVSSAASFVGYWDPDRQQVAQRTTVQVHTGDVGVLENGYLHIADRIDDMIITGGMNVAPAEVERVLEAHDDIDLAAVVGLPHAEWGQEVHAVVRLRDSSASPFDGAELGGWLTERLAGHKRPKHVHVWGELPINRIGKILRREVRRRLLNEHDDREAV